MTVYLYLSWFSPCQSLSHLVSVCLSVFPIFRFYFFLRWEFIKVNKKVRKQELDPESDKWSSSIFLFSWSLSWPRFLFSCFLGHYRGRVLVFLFSFINSHLSFLYLCTYIYDVVLTYFLSTCLYYVKLSVTIFGCQLLKLSIHG